MTAINVASLGMAAISCLGLWLSGVDPKWGWRYGIVSQVVWAAYGVWTGQSGLVVMSAVFSVIYGRNLWRWRHTTFTPVAGPERGASHAT